MSDYAFPQFARLPVELQRAIWRECLPHRVHELDTISDYVVYELDGKPKSCNLGMTTYLNGYPPVVARVCRTARAVALENGHFPVEPDTPSEARWSCICRADHEHWLDPRRDSVHLNWTPACQADWYSEGSPLGCLAWKAAHARGGSFMIDWLDIYGPPSLEEKRAIFKTLPNWRVIQRIIVIHTDFRTGARTGLFGLLGDARVQIVDVSDKERINAFLDLAEECERRNNVDFPQDLHRDDAESVKQKLRDIIIDTFRSQDLLPLIHPAIMFRLCTFMGNGKCDFRAALDQRYPDRDPQRGEEGRGMARGHGY